MERKPGNSDFSGLPSEPTRKWTGSTVVALAIAATLAVLLGAFIYLVYWFFAGDWF